jgi:hypothetical protein
MKDECRLRAGEHGRLGTAVLTNDGAWANGNELEQICKTTKRTQFFCACFFMEQPMNKRVVTEICEKMNWVRFLKRTQLPRENSEWRLVRLGFGGLLEGYLWF